MNCTIERARARVVLTGTLAGLLVAGCTAPIGAERTTVRRAYAQAEANALRTGECSAPTVVVLHRYSLDELAADHPDEAVRQLHKKAVETRERDLLFALSEVSYVAGDEIRRSLKPWEPRDARDFYLGSAMYAWLFLFGDAREAPPGAFDRRFRDACELYNSSLALALAKRRGTNAVVEIKGGRRRLPVGEVELKLDLSQFPSGLDQFKEILSADQFRVRGLSVLNRQPGLGAPLICSQPFNSNIRIRPSMPATVFLRGPASLTELAETNRAFSLEFYSSYDSLAVTVGTNSIPLELDLTTFRAYTLNQSRVWALGRLGFMAPAEHVRNQLMLTQPYEPDRIPLVFVHGTFSSPVTWAEMANTLIADPVLRRRYQLWAFIYASGNPLAQSVADLRSALTAEVERLDPAGTNAALRQMVVIGHSQGGLLTKATAIDNDDKAWRIFSTNKFESLKVTDKERAELRRLMFWTPLPFVKRVVFIATPHRGSYLSGSLARRLAASFVSLPRAMVSQTTDLLRLTAGSEASRFFGNRLPTSLDGMSPKNPSLLAMAEIPVLPPIKAHSIIPVAGDGDPRDGGKDGVVAYQSAHVDYVESEFIVRCSHTCLDNPAAIEEVRRILHEHLDQLNKPEQVSEGELRKQQP